ncbi:MAG: hypothetical protein IJB69_06720 [Clostridia bacterium]|nr:hypothetical protein [Clostridia bacterium]
MDTFEKARGFMYRYARPVDLARWQYHFENGGRENVIRALTFYQNEDGGFGHGLEADNWNPHSSPITTWNACDILYEIGWKDKEHPVVLGILKFLDSGVHFNTDKNQWMNTIPSNNDYPHAIWWGFGGESDYKYNPTAMLAAFILDYADAGSSLYHKALKIAQEAVQWFFGHVPAVERHETACFIPLYECLKRNKITLADMEQFETLLKTQVKCNIDTDTAKWETDYVTKPSAFRIVPGSMFYKDNLDIVKYECGFIRRTQKEDGSFHVPWQWYNDYKEYEAAKYMWKGVIVLENMLHLKANE